MTRSPLVSIITVVYNYGRFIDDSLTSAFAQEYRPIEVIVVDDGSSDDSADRAEKYPDVTVIRQPNKGVSAARNAGVAVATGEFIFFLDADDIMRPEALTDLVVHMVQHPEIVAAFSRQTIRLEAGTPMPVWAQPDLLRGDPGGLPFNAGVYRRSVFDSVGWFSEELRTGEFFELLARVPDVASRVAYLQILGVERRVHDDNLTHDLDPLRANMFASLKRKLDRERQ